MAWLSGWAHRQSITIPSSGWGLSGDLTNQPVKVAITSSNTAFWAGIKADGTDARFTASDGSTLLDFEIEKFDSTGDDAVYHVEVANLLSASDTIIYVYYGNAGATSGESINATWDSNYKAVYHLSQNKAAGAFADSTSNANNGTNTGTTDVAGKIDRGRNFLQSSSQYISVSDSDSLSFGNGSADTALTIEAWVKMTDATGFRIFAKGNEATEEWAFSTTGTDKLFLRCDDESAGGYFYKASDSTLTADEGVFIHIAASYDGGGAGTGITLYRNGAAIAGTATLTGTYVAMENTATPAAIGKWYTALYANGDIDEITISSTARSADWVKARYQSGIGTWTFGGEDGIAVSIPLATFNFATKTPGVYNSGNNINIAIGKTDFNFTGKVPTISILTNVTITIPVATFNFSRYAPTIRTTDIGIGVPKSDFNFAGQAPSISVTGNSVIAVGKATFNFTGYAPSVQLTNTEEEITWGLFDSDGVAITGASPIIKIRSRATGYILDWSDETFKAGGGSSPSTAMQEMDATNFQGYYRKIFTVTSWDNGWYIAATTYSAGTPKQNGSIEFKVQDGQIVDDYNSTNLDMALSTVNANVSLRLPTSSYTAPDNAGITQIQTDIATAQTDITAILNYAVAMSKWKNNKLAKTGISGTVETWVLYDTDDATPLLTWTHDTANVVRTKAT